MEYKFDTTQTIMLNSKTEKPGTGAKNLKRKPKRRVHTTKGKSDTKRQRKWLKNTKRQEEQSEKFEQLNSRTKMGGNYKEASKSLRGKS